MTPDPPISLPPRLSAALNFVSAALTLPVMLGFTLAGGALAVHALRHVREYGHRLAPAATLLLLSVWPRIEHPRGGPNDEWELAFGLGFPVAWAISSRWDHRALVRAFRDIHAQVGHAEA